MENYLLNDEDPRLERYANRVSVRLKAQDESHQGEGKKQQGEGEDSTTQEDDKMEDKSDSEDKMEDEGLVGYVNAIHRGYDNMKLKTGSNWEYGINKMNQQLQWTWEINKGELHTVQNFEGDESIRIFYDDITGSKLNPEGVIQARADEMEGVHRHKVYIKVPINQCWERTGESPITVRWVDINKGDEIHPDYRSRLVARQIKINKREDLFAATPPLEAKKC